MNGVQDSEPVETEDSPVCPECNPELPKRGFYEAQIQRLQEKLEYSTLQNSLLALKCEGLRKELREAKFKERSSIQQVTANPLPDEILRLIFEEAAKFDGLVTPKWNVEKGYPPWTLSLRTRLAIPLVCRQWHMVGLEFLYSHIFLFKPSQGEALSSTLAFLEHKNVNLVKQRLGWIRGLEFFVVTSRGRQGARLALLGGDLMDRLRKGQLQIFGAETGGCLFEDKYVMELVNVGLYRSRGSIRHLHLPCLADNADKASKLDYIYSQSEFRDDLTDFTGFSNLEHLSMACSKSESCGGKGRSPEHQEIYRFLARNPTSLNSLTVNWSQVDDQFLSIALDFVRSAAHLRTVHITLFPKDRFFLTHFNTFLLAVPALQDLVLEVYDGQGGSTAAPGDFTTPILHKSLKRVVLVLDLAASYKYITYFLPIFDGIKKCLFPALDEVTIRGPYPHGCLDGSQVYPSPIVQSWRDAIATCNTYQVNLINEHGHSIHLWEEVHGIWFDPSVIPEADEEEDDGGDGDGDSESEETGASYWEEDSSGFEGSTSAEEDSENDSDDGPYRYISRPDLCYDSTDGTDSD